MLSNSIYFVSAIKHNNIYNFLYFLSASPQNWLVSVVIYHNFSCNYYFFQFIDKSLISIPNILSSTLDSYFKKQTDLRTYCLCDF